LCFLLSYSGEVRTSLKKIINQNKKKKKEKPLKFRKKKEIKKIYIYSGMQENADGIGRSK
jgi:hypothetical protein